MKKYLCLICIAFLAIVGCEIEKDSELLKYISYKNSSEETMVVVSAINPIDIAFPISADNYNIIRKFDGDTIINSVFPVNMVSDNDSIICFFVNKKCFDTCQLYQIKDDSLYKKAYYLSGENIHFLSDTIYFPPSEDMSSMKIWNGKN